MMSNLGGQVHGSCALPWQLHGSFMPPGTSAHTTEGALSANPQDYLSTMHCLPRQQLHAANACTAGVGSSLPCATCRACCSQAAAGQPSEPGQLHHAQRSHTTLLLLLLLLLLLHESPPGLLQAVSRCHLGCPHNADKLVLSVRLPAPLPAPAAGIAAAQHAAAIQQAA
jgi:hypothetical protein